MTIAINAWIILLVYQTLTFDAFHHQRILPVIIMLQFNHRMYIQALITMSSTEVKKKKV